MSYRYTLLSVLALAPWVWAIGQTNLYIPPVLSGTTINLTLDEAQKEIMPGMMTPTIGYNGAMLGPTLILDQGDSVQFNVQNDYADTTTVHWHGLNVAPMNDGSPHNAILPGQLWSPSFTIRDKAATYWYHPHPHGKTMEQVIKGAAGLIIVRDPEESALDLPRTYGVDDIPVVLQFKQLDANGQLMMTDEFDDHVVVNGDLLPTASLPAQVVRLRLLNGSSHRSFRLGNTMLANFKQIASDAGLLDAPVTLTRLNLNPGERAEILLDLTGMEGMSFDLMTYGNELPAGVMGGPTLMGMPLGPLDNISFPVMTITVAPQTSSPVTTMPTTLTTNVAWPEASASQTINLSFQELPMGGNSWFINGVKFDMDRIDYTTTLGSSVIWVLSNNSMMGHPVHIHGGHFYILDRGGAQPPANELGRKDVVFLAPMTQARVIMKYEHFSDPDMPYMYHCHILSHEDDGMMGQFIVSSATGINDSERGVAPTLYPNPASGMVTVSAMSISDRIRISDMSGRVVLDLRPGTTSYALNTTALLDGVYAVTVYSKGNTGVARLVVQH